MKSLVAMAVVAMFALSWQAWAKEAQPLAQDEALEQHVMDLSKELRCLKCQNQSIADSKSGFADSVRDVVREQMRAGKSDSDIKSFLIDRYGDFIVYQPPFTMANALIWLAPIFVLLAGMIALIMFIKRQQRNKPDQVEVSTEDAERLKHLLNEGKS